MVRRFRATVPRVAAFIGTLLLAGTVGANSLVSLSRGTDAIGRTVATALFAETVKPELVRSFDIADPPRRVVAVESVLHSLDTTVLPIGDAFVSQIRLVHHAVRTPPELLLVFDVVDSAVAIVDVVCSGRRLEVTLDRISPGQTPTPETPATRAPVIRSTPPVEPTVRLTVGHEASPSPTPSPIPHRPATATPTPSPSSTPTRHPPSPTPVVVGFPTPVPAVDEPDATRIQEISLSNRSDGTTLMLLSADGPVTRSRVRYMRVSGAEPRIVVTLRGLSAPDLPRSRSVEDPNLLRIRLVHSVESRAGELHVLVTPDSPAVTVRCVEVAGPNVVVLFSKEASP